MDTTTEVGDWGRYYGGGYATVRDVVVEFLGPDASTELVDAVTHRYRAAIDALTAESDIRLNGDTFYAAADSVDISEEVILEVIEAVDLAEIADAVEAEGLAGNGEGK